MSKGISAKEKWYFTFGSNHTTADGYPLGHCYCVIEGSYGEAREKLVKLRGDRWSFQYNSAEAAGVESFGLHLVPLDVICLNPDMDDLNPGATGFAGEE